MTEPPVGVRALRCLMKYLPLADLMIGGSASMYHGYGNGMRSHSPMTF